VQRTAARTHNNVASLQMNPFRNSAEELTISHFDDCSCIIESSAGRIARQKDLSLTKNEKEETAAVHISGQRSCMLSCFLSSHTHWCRWSSGRGSVIPPCRSGFESRCQCAALAVGVHGCGGVHSTLTAGITCVKGLHVVTCA